MLRRTVLQLPAVPGLLRAAGPPQAEGSKSKARVRCWLQTSLKRVFPGSEAESNQQLELLSARNQRLSFQVCVRNETQKEIAVRCDVAGPADVGIQVRRIGYVPLPHHTTDVP